MTTDTDMPIGTVVAYGGDLSITANLNAIQAAGWLLCDGMSYDQTTQQALFNAIGNNFGGNSTDFNVPNFQGSFIRGTSYDAGNQVDPDELARTAVALGGNTGNHTGSYQTSATASPHNPWIFASNGAHTHTISPLTSSQKERESTGNFTAARGNTSAQTTTNGAHTHQLVNYDSTSAPICVYLYFIIRAQIPSTAPSPSGTIPNGAILHCAASLANPENTLNAPWYRCDGASYGKTQCPSLFATIGANFGGDGSANCNVPDLRGYFLRGTSHESDRDPDASSRYALFTGGNKGNAIGSAQGYATGKPAALSTDTAATHIHTLGNVPDSSCEMCAGGLGDNVILWTGDVVTSDLQGNHTHTIATGGDHETRPINTYLDYIIASTDLSNCAAPVGSILPFAGDTTNTTIVANLLTAGWLPCLGNSYSTTTYATLYGVLNQIYGYKSGQFDVPDLQGYFLCSVGSGNSPSPSIGKAVTVSTTGAPANAFTTTQDGDHSHTFTTVPYQTDTIYQCDGWNMAQANSSQTNTSSSGAHSHSLQSGGDNETRPSNIYVDFIIRYK